MMGCIMHIWPLLTGNWWQDERTLPQALTGEVQVEHQEEFLHGTLEWTTQGAARVTIPGSVHEMTGHGTQCHRLVDKVVSKVGRNDHRGSLQPK